MEETPQVQKPMRHWLTRNGSRAIVAWWYGTVQPVWSEYWNEWWHSTLECRRASYFCIDELERVFPGIAPSPGQCVEISLQLKRLTPNRNEP